MLGTFQGLVIGLGFLAPGILFEIGIERVVGYWRTSLADRLFRFFAESVIFQAVAAPLTSFVLQHYHVFTSPPYGAHGAQTSHGYGHLPWLV